MSEDFLENLDRVFKLHVLGKLRQDVVEIAAVRMGVQLPEEKTYLRRIVQLACIVLEEILVAVKPASERNSVFFVEDKLGDVR